MKYKNKDAIKPEMKLEFKSEKDIYLHVFLYELARKNATIFTAMNNAKIE
jgi:hypothetical protein